MTFPELMGGIVLLVIVLTLSATLSTLGIYFTVLLIKQIKEELSGKPPSQPEAQHSRRPYA